MEFQQENFEKSAENLKQAVEKGAPKGESHYYIAESYRLSNRISQAETHYKKAIQEGIREDNALFHYAFAMKANGNYQGARQQLEKYLKYGTNFEHLEFSKKEIRNLKRLEEIAMRLPAYKIENCKDLNTEGIEYAPVLKDDVLYFTSSRGEGPMYMGQGTRFTDIYRFEFDSVSRFSGKAIPLDPVINQPKTHEASATFTPDGRTMVFARSNTGKKRDINQEVDLYESQLVDGEWTEPERLPFTMGDYWDSNPSFSPDGTELYFSSNRPGGYGQDDIWKVLRMSNGSWGDPVNLGGDINTKGQEQFPFLHPNGDFYFSSTGHPGFGKLDLFVYKRDPNGNMQVRNLGKPVNSPHDDFAIHFWEGENGFFCSNRPGGVGDDDIYYFVHDFKPKYVLKGVVKGKLMNDKGQVLEETEILPNSKVVLSDMDENEIAQMEADSLAEFEFEVEPEKEYMVSAESQGYIARDKEFSTVGKTVSKEKMEFFKRAVEFNTEVILDPIAEGVVLKFPPIYYPYNSWDITEDAEKVLDEMVTVLKRNPAILVELGSHTDARGSAKYNKRLSQNRAESAVNYILSKGISKDRIDAKGYGEDVPKVLKEDTLSFPEGTILRHVMLDSLEQAGDTTASELGHQLNRRTEFKIVGVIEGEIDIDNIRVIESGEEEEIKEEKKIEHQDELIERYLEKDDDKDTTKPQTVPPPDGN